MTVMTLIKQGARHLRLMLLYQHDINKKLPQDKSVGIWYHPDCDCFELGERRKYKDGTEKRADQEW